MDFDALHLHYYSDAQQREQESLAPEHRTRDFREVTAGLSEKGSPLRVRPLLFLR